MPALPSSPLTQLSATSLIWRKALRMIGGGCWRCWPGWLIPGTGGACGTG